MVERAYSPSCLGGRGKSLSQAPTVATQQGQKHLQGLGETGMQLSSRGSPSMFKALGSILSYGKEETLTFKAALK